MLGSTRVQLALPDRVPILIDYDATETTLASLTVGELTGALGRQQIGRDEMGRALGRVAAHEIGHVLLALPNHQRQGLMRESFQAIDMVVPVRFVARCRRWRSRACVTDPTGLSPTGIAPDRLM